MANELNIPGFKHYELDSTYQAKLAAGEVNAKDLSFVKETGKIYTQGGEYGGGLQYAIERTIQAGDTGELTSEQMAYNAETFSMVNNMQPVVISFMGCVSIPYVDPSKEVVVFPLVMMDLAVMPIYITSNGNIEVGPQKIKDFIFEADPSEQAQYVVAYFSDLGGTRFLGSAKEARAYVQHLYNNHYYICVVDVCSKYTDTSISPNEIGVIEYNFGSQRFRRIYSTATGELVKEEEIQLGGSGGGDVEIIKVYAPPQPNSFDGLTESQIAENAMAFTRISNAADAGKPFLIYINGIIHANNIGTDENGSFIRITAPMFFMTNYGSYRGMGKTYIELILAPDGRSYYEELEEAAPNPEGGSGTNIVVDTAMSDSSENAVQNKVVKKYVDDAVAGAITTTLNTAV